ncbi:MAG: desulfoferrodoxin family protein [Eubacteriales bacterium]|nr:desulfoferrodoxin family protein [Eubacteriales bacterium]
MEERYFICGHCGNIITFVEDAGVPVTCCGEKMQALIPGTVDAAVEKHIPVYEIRDGQVHVQVGAVKHPMVPEHYIQWVSLVTDSGIQRRRLHPGMEPRVCFALCPGEQVRAVYAYCNIHGLWKSEG